MTFYDVGKSGLFDIRIENFLEKARLSQLLALSQIIFLSQALSEKARFVNFGLKSQYDNADTTMCSGVKSHN